MNIDRQIDTDIDTDTQIDGYRYRQMDTDIDRQILIYRQMHKTLLIPWRGRYLVRAQQQWKTQDIMQYNKNKKQCTGKQKEMQK